MKVVHSSDAVTDQIRECLFWREKDPQLSERFFNEIINSISHIKQNSEAYRLVDKSREIRRYYQKHFHSMILYRYIKEENLLRILRVYNTDMEANRFL